MSNNGRGNNGRGNSGKGNNGRGPPAHARATRRDDGAIEVEGDRTAALEAQIDWDSLSPLEEYLLLRLAELED